MKMSSSNILALFLLGFVNTINIYLLMKMHSLNELSVSSVIVTLRIVLVPIFAFLFVGERLNFMEYVGIATVFMGVSIVTSPRKLIRDGATRVALLFATTTAVTTTLLKGLVADNSVPILALFMSFPLVFVIPLISKNKKRLVMSIKTDFVKKAGIALVSAATVSLLAFALRFGAVGKVNAIFQSMAILTVISGIVILKERERMLYKIVGIVIAATGTLLLV
jgi:drug/metabolite transporter (DMT)-like permease